MAARLDNLPLRISQCWAVEIIPRIGWRNAEDEDGNVSDERAGSTEGTGGASTQVGGQLAGPSGGGVYARNRWPVEPVEQRVECLHLRHRHDVQVIDTGLAAPFKVDN